MCNIIEISRYEFILTWDISHDKNGSRQIFLAENFKVILKNLIPSVELRWCGGRNFGFTLF